MQLSFMLHFQGIPERLWKEVLGSSLGWMRASKVKLNTRRSIMGEEEDLTREMGYLQFGIGLHLPEEVNSSLAVLLDLSLLLDKQKAAVAFCQL